MKMEADLHTHTVASGHAFSTLKEMVEQAALVGLKMMAITDHGLNMPGGPHQYYFSQVIGLPGEICGVEVLKGVEANIIDMDGNIDMPLGILKKLDLVLAGFHPDTGYRAGSVEQNTQALIAAIKNPFVHMISHPGDPEFPVDLEKVVLAAKMAGKALEINNSSFVTSRPGSPPRCTQMARLAARAGTLVAVNSDAHSCFAVGRFDHALEVVDKAGIKPDRVLNTSASLVKKYLQSFKVEDRKIS
jgi:putative hydrolase